MGGTARARARPQGVGSSRHLSCTAAPPTCSSGPGPGRGRVFGGQGAVCGACLSPFLLGSGPPSARTLPRPRKKRTVYLKEQLQELEKHFWANRYPSYQERVALAAGLNLDEHQVQVGPLPPPSPLATGSTRKVALLRPDHLPSVPGYRGEDKPEGPRAPLGVRASKGPPVGTQGGTPGSPPPCAGEPANMSPPRLTIGWVSGHQSSGPLGRRGTLWGRPLPGPRARGCPSPAPTAPCILVGP